MKSELPKRSLGTSGLAITTVGFGAWAIGGGGWSYGWGPQDDSSSITAMRHAVELGVNWIDTAAVYGLGHSEQVVGSLLRSLPPSERPLIFTKCGLIGDRYNPMAEPQRVLKPASIRAECEASLRRLGIERIDLYQFHWPDETGIAVEDSWAEMARLVEEGKVRLAGVSNFDVALLERCEAVRHVDSLQPPFSLIRRDAGEHEIPWCYEHKTGVICYSPMQSGLLTDNFSAGRVAAMAEDDWRRHSFEFQNPNLNRNLALRDALRPIARRHFTTVSSVAITWVLSWPGVTGAIVGARSPEQVDGWISAGSLVLTAADLDEISRAIEATGTETFRTYGGEMRRTWGLVLMILIPALTLAAWQHGSHSSSTATTESNDWTELMESMNRMHLAMTSVEPSGNDDTDFVKLMLPHHQAAIDMAKTELQHGKDPQMRRLAQEIIADQQSEIDLMQLWLKKAHANSAKTSISPNDE